MSEPAGKGGLFAFWPSLRSDPAFIRVYPSLSYALKYMHSNRHSRDMFFNIYFQPHPLGHPICPITRPCPPNDLPSRTEAHQAAGKIYNLSAQVRDLPRCSKGDTMPRTAGPAEQIPRLTASGTENDASNSGRPRNGMSLSRQYPASRQVSGHEFTRAVQGLD